MESDRQKILMSYMDTLQESADYRSVGRKFFAVRLFLESDFPITRTGYKKFSSANSMLFSSHPFMSSCLLDFLNWKGVGFARKKKKAVVADDRKVLEKIEVVCEKNQKILNDFTNYLMVETDLSPNTVSSYSTGVRLFFQYATEFNVENCRAYLATMEKNGSSPKTINIRINCLTRLGEFLKKPVALKRIKIQRSMHTENVPTLDDYNRVIEYLKGKSMVGYFSVRILATTGARVSEFLQITWEDILKGEVTLKGKGSKYRNFFFAKDLIKEAKEYVKETGVSGVVCKNRFGEPMTTRGVASNMRDLAPKLGIDKSKLHPHAFRHFFAKMYLKKNKDVVQLAELLGHGSVDTTRLYLQKSYSEQRNDFRKNVTW